MKKIFLLSMLFVSLPMFSQVDRHHLEVAKNLDIFNAVYKQLDMMYVDTLDAHEIITYGIDAMLSALDPYTEYYPEEDLKDFKPKEYVISDSTAELMRKLKAELKTVEGKKKYGYLPKQIKNIVDELLKQIVNENPDLTDMYSKWNEVNRQKLSVYREASKEPDIPIEQNKEFKSLKNMLIEAVNEMIIIGNSKTVMNNRLNKSLCVNFITAAATLLSGKTANRINALTAQSRSFKDSKVLEKERQKKLAHGDKSVDTGYDKEEKDEYTSEVAADNIAALLEIFELITRGNAEVKREEERLRAWYQEYQPQQALTYDEDEDEDYDEDYEEKGGMTLSL